ncbi:MAG: bacteriophage CI repressor [Lachnospiraceae bacterium]|nr:bacteriophage CI repressor [Lachnospiraceae bacterium]
MSSNTNEHIIMRIKNLLAANKSFTQKDLAIHLQKAPSTISQWFTKNRELPAECIIPICEFLGCSINWLLTGTDISFESKSDCQEQKLLEYYRHADERGKRNIMRQAESEISELSPSNNQTSSDSKTG